MLLVANVNAIDFGGLANKAKEEAAKKAKEEAAKKIKDAAKKYIGYDDEEDDDDEEYEKPAKKAKASGNNSKANCIKAEFKISANTFDDIAEACEARRSEVLSQISGTNIGSCLKNDLDFDMPIKQIKTQCGVTELVSSNFNSLQAGLVAGTPLTDPRNGKKYETVIIGKKTWMAENLNYYVDDSKCYKNASNNCNLYGRLYNWATAMNLDSDCNSSNCANKIQQKHKGICPEGWHLPSSKELDALDKSEGKKFFITLGGSGFLDGSFEGVSSYGSWWSSSASEGDYYSVYKYTNHNGKNFNKEEEDKNTLLSVRCVGD